MRSFQRSVRAAPWLVFATMVVVMVAGPRAVSDRVRGTLVASWKAAGGALVSQELAAMGRRIAADSDELARAQAGRDALEVRLCELAARREVTGPRADRARSVMVRMSALMSRLPEGDERAALGHEAERQLQLCLGADVEVRSLEEAARALAAEIDRADRLIESTRARLDAAETALAVLAAAEEARRLRRSLDALGEAPTAPRSRVAEILEALDHLTMPERVSFAPHP
jgi:hypothetical protein